MKREALTSLAFPSGKCASVHLRILLTDSLWYLNIGPLTGPPYGLPIVPYNGSLTGPPYRRSQVNHSTGLKGCTSTELEVKRAIYTELFLYPSFFLSLVFSNIQWLPLCCSLSSRRHIILNSLPYTPGKENLISIPLYRATGCRSLRSILLFFYTSLYWTWKGRETSELL